MKKLFIGFIALLLTVTLFHSCNEALINEPTDEELELKSAALTKKSYIVVLNDAELNAELVKLKGYEKKQEAVKTASAKILKRAGALDGEVEFVYGTALKGFSVKIPPGQLKKLQNDPSVKYIEENKVISLIQPESVVVTGDISAQAQLVPWGIARVNGGVDGSGKTAWVIDTGTDIDHPDLNVDQSRDYDFVNNDSDADDDNGHGTHVAGTIAALDNGLGVIGVAAGATIVPVKVLDASGSGWTDGVIAGVDYVANNASTGDVANMSLGGGISTVLDDAVLTASTKDGKNILFALAAGNERNDADLHSPARVNGPNIYTIAAFGEGNAWASYSNYGIPPVDYCEPGSAILSTYIDGQYATGSGTSMATPHMAGILLMGNYETDGYIIRKRNDSPYPVAVLGSVGSTDNTPPSADFSFTTNGLDASFTDLSSDTDGSITGWSWNFGDGKTSTSQNPTNTYDAAGTYQVTLTVTDDDGDTDEIIKDVTVTENTGGEIVLSAVISGNKVKKTTLNWIGATGTTVDIYKIDSDNVTTTTTVTNSGSYNENLGKIITGTFTYYIVDEIGVESNHVQVSVTEI